MVNLERFIDDVIFSHGFEHSEQNYSAILKYLSQHESAVRDFSNSFKKKIHVLDLSSTRRIVSLLDDMVFTYEIQLNDLYSEILQLMFRKSSFDASLSSSFLKLLIGIKRDKVEVFSNVVEYIKDFDPTKVNISLYALYGNYPDFAILPESVLQNYLEIIQKCLRANSYLKKDAKHYLEKRVKGNNYEKYLNDFFS
ncbi:hypothetical protein B5M42_004960 [Paenibacillus athensensis]|uniref:Uncharacterized protein n=1 Tax=Paenibacillus athensensis TaxID=1967502 RepID=A0A4Y8PV66_9BACL|nr:hypothetical protein [Paenibacillus athensensis]MCD1258188.1 hypothetical protein [Paenibacillus athensensis]